jgi:cbb3-type cytochrome oxidase maturation protein
MIMLYFLIPLSILVAAAFLGAFIWAVRSGQYEDTTTPSMRVLLDEPITRPVSPDPRKAEQESSSKL